MGQKTLKLLGSFLLLAVLFSSLASAVIVDTGFVTIYPGESGNIDLDVENNERFDIEDVSISLNLNGMPFTTIGSSEKNIDEIDRNDDDSVEFELRASTDITPGDYNIPYAIKYTNAENTNETFEKTGSFGLRVSAKTDLDFAIETNEDAIVGHQGRIILEIINRGLGEIKSVSVEVIPQGFELTSKEKTFIGSIEGDDSDTASFNVIYRATNPTFSAKITYKDFDNEDQTQTLSMPLNVYTEEQALQRGLIQGPNYTIYIIIGIIVLAFLIYRLRKKRKRSRR